VGWGWLERPGDNRVCSLVLPFSLTQSCQAQWEKCRFSLRKTQGLSALTFELELPNSCVPGPWQRWAASCSSRPWAPDSSLFSSSCCPVMDQL
jgi:hypothetical protein